jgi:two-component system nitrogen regulation response regulator GlnG
VEVDGAPLGESCDLSADALGRGVVLLVAGRVALLLHRFSPIWDPGPDHGLVGASDAVVDLRREISRVAGLRVPVLLEGETGSGKELVALAIHRAGSGARRPFRAVNMGAVPPTLAAAELFGSARGAYTGADRRRSGYFARADGGTLFLDEIGETPAEVQVLLLRALESGEIQPVGGEATQSVDVRVVAASDADLAAAAAAGRFRSPLLHRLNGYPIRVPPLRERRDDLGRLLFHFLRRELADMGDPTPLQDPGPRGRPWLPAPLVARLAGLDWPGNVRQLRNVVRQITIAGRGAAEARLPASLLSGRAAAAAAPEAPAAVARRYRDPGEVGEAELVAAMERHRFRLAPTAADLGISRTALYDLVDRCPSVRKAAELSRGEIEAARRRCGGDLAAMAGDLRVSKRGLQLRLTALGAP